MDILRTIPETDAGPDLRTGVILWEHQLHSGQSTHAMRRAHKAELAGGSPSLPTATGRDLSVPILILVGDKDLWTSTVRCRALERTPNVKVVVYAGVGHGFVMPFGHQVEYNHNAAGDAKVVPRPSTTEHDPMRRRYPRRRQITRR